MTIFMLWLKNVGLVLTAGGMILLLGVLFRLFVECVDRIADRWGATAAAASAICAVVFIAAGGLTLLDILFRR